jgi:hypothetical protein
LSLVAVCSRRSASFKEAFMGGSTAVIYPLLRYIVERVPDMKQRAYLARFLRPVDVPEEMFADASEFFDHKRLPARAHNVLVRLAALVALFQRQKELQADFREVHKTVRCGRFFSCALVVLIVSPPQVSKIRGSTPDPKELEAEIKQLGSEKEQLTNKLAKLRLKVL